MTEPEGEENIEGSGGGLLTIAAAIACITVAGIGLSLSSPLISLILSGRGVSSTVIGLNTSTASIGNLLIGIFIAPLAARVGVRSFLLATLVCGAASLAAFAGTDSLAAWFVLRLVFGASMGSLFVLSEFWIGAAAPRAHRGLIMGIYATALSMGFAAGPALLAAVGDASPPLFTIGACFFLLAAVPIVLVGANAPPLTGETRHSVLGFVRNAPIAILAAYVFGAIEQGSFAFMPLYGDRLGLTPRLSAVLLVVFGLGNVVSQIPLGLLSDRVNRSWLLFACATISGIAAFAMPLVSGSLPALFALVFIAGGVVGGLYTVGLAQLGARFSGSELATANAAFVMFYSLGMLTGSPAIGFMVDAVVPHGFAVGFGLFCLVYAAMALVRLHNLRRAADGTPYRG